MKTHLHNCPGLPEDAMCVCGVGGGRGREEEWGRVAVDLKGESLQPRFETPVSCL